MIRVLLLSMTLLALGSCDAPGPLKAERDVDGLFGPSEDNTVVVDAILIVDRPLPHVDLRRAASPGVAYAAAGAALTGATVAIHRDGGVYDYLRDPVTDGRYLPPPGADMVAPDTVYELRVLIVGEPEVRATTRTPARVRIADVILLDDTFENEVRSLRRFEEIGDGVYDAPENQLEFGFGLLEAQVAMEGSAASFQFGVTNLEAASPLLIDSDFVDDEDELEREEASELLRLDEGSLYLPWFGIYYAGRHKVRLFAVDQNWFDLVRTDNVDAERNTGETGQSFQRPLFHVDNGIGLFASASVDSFGFFVRREGSPPCTGCECWGCGDRSSWSGILDLNTGRGRIRYDRDVGTGATCELSYEVAEAVLIDPPCETCSFAWELEFGELTVYRDKGACEDAEDLEGTRLQFGPATEAVIDEQGNRRFGLYIGENDLWRLLEHGWSLVVSTATEERWLFGFDD